MTPATPPPFVRARPAADAQLERVGDQYALPSRFLATVEPGDPALPICHLALAVERGRVVCEQLTLERRAGGPPVGGAMLRRVPVADYTRRAADALGQWLIPGDPDGEWTISAPEFGEVHPLPVVPFDEGHVATPITGLTHTAAFRAANRAPREKGRVSDDTLRRVADIYRAAHLAGRPPTQAVADEMLVAYSTAGRYVMRARRAGFLKPTRRGTAGEVD